MIRPLVLVDLDDTLFQTEAKCPPGLHGQLVLAAPARNGRHSHMTPVQDAFVAWLLASAEVVPVTARGTASYRAVAIPFAHAAIVANGAAVLHPGGEQDPAWQALMQAELAPFASRLDALVRDGQAAALRLGLSVRAWTEDEDGLKTFAVFKENGDTGGTGLVGLAGALAAPDGWVLHVNGNNLAYIPPPVSKRRAAAHVIARARAAEPHRPVLGLGDSVSDLAFLSLCDWWGAPRNSQIAHATKGLGGWLQPEYGA